MGSRLEKVKGGGGGENEEWSLDYGKFGEIGDEEGLGGMGKMYGEIGVGEKGDEERQVGLVKNIEDDKVLKKDVEVVWEWGKCGQIYVGREGGERCGGWLDGEGYLEVKKNNQ